MQLPIVQAGDPILRLPAKQILAAEIKTAYIQELIEQMRETMLAAPGVGLAAPQIGLGIRLVVIEDAADERTKLSREQMQKREREPVPFHVLINPELTVDADEQVEFFEGCLSVNGFAASTPRFRYVTVTAMDQNGEEFKRKALGWYARILQHEVDHLDGMLYIDRMNTRTFTTVENKAKYSLD